MDFSPNETFLRSFHATRPGCTSQTMATATTADGHTSYELLASAVPVFSATGQVRVLDLACGDGYLLELLANRNQPGLELHGIDMTVAELSAAERRLKGRAQLHLGRAQTLPFADSSFDIVISHMAFMLMDEVDVVVSEIKRILKPSGKFSAIVGAVGAEVHPPQAAFRKLIRARLRSEDMEFLAGIGDPRMRDADGDVSSIFADGFAKPVMIKDHALKTKEPVEQTLQHYMTFYGPNLLSPTDFASLEWHFREALLKMADSDGLLERIETLREITVIKAAVKSIESGCTRQ